MNDDADLGFGSGTRNESRGMRDCSLVVCDRQADGETPLLTGSHGDFLHLLDRVARGFNAREIASFAGVTDERIHRACWIGWRREGKACVSQCRSQWSPYP